MPKSLQRCIGLIGHPVAHSRSPQMQQAALDALGIAARYELWDTPADHLAKRVASMRDPEILGANVTIPYKAAVAPLLDVVAPDARRHTGVVNTIVREETPQGPRLVGYNTDFLALLRVFDERDVWRVGARMLVLGAGGAAQAALGAAVLRGAEPWVAARHRSAARRALEHLYARQSEATSTVGSQPDDWKTHAVNLEDADTLTAALAQTHILVNATPVGTRDLNASPIPLEYVRLLPRGAFVLDMVYNPPETALVRTAHAAGLGASGGLSMLLYQGAEAFTLWTHQPAQLAIMRAALEQSLTEP